MSGILANDSGASIYPVRPYSKYEVYKSLNSFTAGVSPVTWGISTDLAGASTNPHIRGNRGYIVVDGIGDLLVEIANESTNYNAQFTLKSGDRFDLTGMGISNIRFTHSGTDTNFRGFCL